jgi:metallo-beta-lactamase class B
MQVRVGIVTAALLLAPIASINAGEPAVSIYALKGSLYIAEDSHYAKTNYVVYLGAKSVTVVGAGWSPETAELLAQELGKITDKPIENVIIPDHDPEYAGGIAYWKRIGANVVATETTERALRTEWPKATEFTRKHFPTYPNVPLELPTNIYERDFELENGHIRAFYLGPRTTPMTSSFIFQRKEFCMPVRY